MEEKKGVLNGLFGFFSKGWEVNEKPTNARCEAYTSQINNAQEQLKKKDLSKKERKFFKKEKEQGLEGLHCLDVENKEFIIKAICGVGFACLAFVKVASVIQENQKMIGN